MSFLDEFRAAMNRAVGKTVTRTDVGKGAYVPNEGQRQVMDLAGFQPEPHTNGRTIGIRVAGTNEILDTSYYPSVRAGSGREPEIRMGRGIVNWVREGETLWLGTDLKTVFAFKSTSALYSTLDQEQIEEAVERLGRFIDPRKVMEKAKASAGPPGRRETVSTVFERNAWVREFARQRSGGKCEMPGCTYVGFIKVDGTKYIEVHHIQSMARAGFDVIDNVAAICPNCHAKAHYARDKATIETQLAAAIKAANDRYVPTL